MGLIGWSAVADMTQRTNVVIVGEDGDSVLVTSGDEPIVLFERTAPLPATRGFFSRRRVWAGNGDIRITTLNGQCLIFVAGERVDTVDLPKESLAEEILFYRFSEHGHTLRIMLQSDAVNEEDPLQNTYTSRIIITRP